MMGRIRNDVECQSSKITDTARKICNLKLHWAGPVCRTAGRWNRLVLEWIPRLGKRSVRRSAAKWGPEEGDRLDVSGTR